MWNSLTRLAQLVRLEAGSQDVLFASSWYLSIQQGTESYSCVALNLEFYLLPNPDGLELQLVLEGVEPCQGKEERQAQEEKCEKRDGSSTQKEA